MAELIISPGVFNNENVPTVLEAAAAPIGAAIIGPAVKGPVGIPTTVTTYSDYLNKFGGGIVSGGAEYSYFTGISAQNYFKQGGSNLLVTRVASGSFGAASGSIVNNVTITGGSPSSGSSAVDASFDGSADNDEYRIIYGGTTYRFIAGTAPLPENDVDGNVYYFESDATAATAIANASTAINGALSGSIASSSLDLVETQTNSTTLAITASSAGTAFDGILVQTGSAGSFTTFITTEGGVNGVGSSTSFTLQTISEGEIMNSVGAETTGNALVSGSRDNLRWEVQNVNSGSGTFNLLIRQGNDRLSDKNVLEIYRGVSLDPKRDDYIAKVIGNQEFTAGADGDDAYVSVTGEYPNKSKYVIVKSVDSATPDYLDGAGNFKSEFTSSLPYAQSGSFGGGIGSLFDNQGVANAGINFYNSITATNVQGLTAGNYTDAINLLRNKDQYAFNVLTIPGLTYNLHSSTLDTVITNTTTRGDSIFPIDVVNYGATTAEAITQGNNLDTSYAAAYWPWLLVKDENTAANVWVPASTIIPSVYVFNDNNSEPWFAPAGFTRGTMPNVVAPEKTLPRALRDNLYDAKINPIATFPGTGVVVYGQKTLQSISNALDRVNVRRLLIALKGFINTTSQNLLFEPNTLQTRNSFLSTVIPYLETVQQNNGLYAFKVIMDDSNNGPDVIDRNELRGAIYLQPVKTAEFIVLDFNLTPTGADFPA